MAAAAAVVIHTIGALHRAAADQIGQPVCRSGHTLRSTRGVQGEIGRHEDLHAQRVDGLHPGGDRLLRRRRRCRRKARNAGLRLLARRTGTGVRRAAGRSGRNLTARRTLSAKREHRDHQRDHHGRGRHGQQPPPHRTPILPLLPRRPLGARRGGRQADAVWIPSAR